MSDSSEPKSNIPKDHNDVTVVCGDKRWVVKKWVLKQSRMIANVMEDLGEDVSAEIPLSIDENHASIIIQWMILNDERFSLISKTDVISQKIKEDGKLDEADHQSIKELEDNLVKETTLLSSMKLEEVHALIHSANKLEIRFLILKLADIHLKPLVRQIPPDVFRKMFVITEKLLPPDLIESYNGPQEKVNEEDASKTSFKDSVEREKAVPKRRSKRVAPE